MVDGYATRYSPSARETEVLHLAITGVTSDKHIAGQLGLTPKTVETYWSRIFLKAGLHSRTGVVAACLTRERTNA
jgi:DNA-binding NarL/FixJ family response regulator